MPTPTRQNWDNKEVVVEANELIAFFKESKNPWSGNAFPTVVVQNSVIKFIVKKAIETVNKVTDKSERTAVEYIDTETRTEIIKNMYTSGQKILEVDLLADNGQDLKSTAQYEVANNLNRQIAADDTLAVITYAEIVEITADDPVANLTAMLKGYDILFQRGNEANCKFNITNELYDKLVYLANNKGIITDNNIAQQLRLDGTKLFVKGIECNIIQDVYMINEEEKMPWVLFTPKAMKRYVLQSANVYIEAVKDGSVPKMILIGGEVTSDAFPYMLQSETTSRWMLRGKYAGRKPLTEIVKETDLKAEDNIVPVPTNDDIPVAGQVANAVIKKNSDATINDFLIDQDSVKVTKKPVDGDPYQYGEATAVVTGAGNYEGSVTIEFNFGRLNPFSVPVTEEIEDNQPESVPVTEEIEDNQPESVPVTEEIENNQPESVPVTEEIENNQPESEPETEK